MNLIERLKSDIGDPSKKKDLSEKALKDLGYAFTSNNIEVESKAPENGQVKEKFYLREVIETDSPKRVLDFCYLFSVGRQTGIIINQPFYRYADFFNS
jgi:hypothetical protein